MTNNRIHVRNTHMIASSNSTKGDERENRTRYVRKQNKEFFRNMEDLSAHLVCGGGDFNQKKTDPDLKPYVPKSWKWDTPGPTHKDAWIDHIGHINRAGVVRTNAGVIQQSSDHKTVWVEYLLHNQYIVRIASYNVGAGKHERKVTDWLALARHTDVIMLQEAGDREAEVRDFLTRTSNTWGVIWMDDTNPGRKTAILYNKKTLRLDRWRMTLAVAGGIWLGVKGAGPDKTEPKYITKGRFTLRTKNARKKNR